MGHCSTQKYTDIESKLVLHTIYSAIGHVLETSMFYNKFKCNKINCYNNYRNVSDKKIISEITLPIALPSNPTDKVSYVRLSVGGA